MPRVSGAHTGAAQQMLGVVDNARGQHQQRADNYFIQGITAIEDDKNRILDGIERFAQAKKKHEEEKKAKERRDSQGLFGIGGGAAGMAIGAILAVPTGGLSVLAGAAVGGAIGGVVGSGVDALYTEDPRASSGYAQRASQSLQSIPSTMMLSPIYNPNLAGVRAYEPQGPASAITTPAPVIPMGGVQPWQQPGQTGFNPNQYARDFRLGR